MFSPFSVILTITKYKIKGEKHEIDLPACDLHECRYYADENCKDTNRYGNCMYKYYKAAYEKLISDESFEDEKFPKVPGYYAVLVFDKRQNKMKRIGYKWNDKKFIDIENFYNIVAWQKIIKKKGQFLC